MGFLGFGVKEGEEAVKTTTDGLSNLTQSISTAITNDIPPVQRGNLLMKALEVTTALAQAAASTIIAEAQGKSWLQRNWRPCAMVFFLVLIALDSFALLSRPLPEEAWVVVKWGLGGYVVGRSGEKIVEQLRRK